MPNEVSRSGYGLAIKASEYNPTRSLIGAVERTVAGNIVMRVGRELTAGAPGIWSQTEYIVMTPEETHSLIAEFESLLLESGR